MIGHKKAQKAQNEKVQSSVFRLPSSAREQAKA